MNLKEIALLSAGSIIAIGLILGGYLGWNKYSAYRRTELILEASQAYQSGDCQQAISLFDAAGKTTLERNHLKIMADCSRILGNSDEATEIEKTIIDKFGLSNSSASVGSIIQIESTTPQNYYPDSMKLYLETANQLAKDDKLSEAYQSLSASIKDNPDLEVYFYLAIADIANQFDDKTRANDAYQKILIIDPENSSALLGLNQMLDNPNSVSNNIYLKGDIESEVDQ